MRGNRNSDLLGSSASRRESRDAVENQKDTLFEQEYYGRGAGVGFSGEQDDQVQAAPAGIERPSGKRRMSYAEARAARLSESGEPEQAAPKEENAGDDYHGLPLRYHPQTEGFIPEVRNMRERLRSKGTGEPSRQRDIYEEPDYVEEEMTPPSSRGQYMQAPQEDDYQPMPQRREEPSYYYDDDNRGGMDAEDEYDRPGRSGRYEARQEERRGGRRGAGQPRNENSLMLGRAARENVAVPQSQVSDGVICPKCHAVNPEGARFCNGCGSNLTAAEGKRGYARRRVPEAEAAYESRKQQVIAVYSPKGGVGKSTVTKELAYMFANSADVNGHEIRVIVVDVDLDMPDVSTLFRVVPRPNMADWTRDIEADREAGRALRYEPDEIKKNYVVKVAPNLDVLCGTENLTEAKMITAGHLKTMITALQRCDYDIIMLDCANGVNVNTMRPLFMANQILWIATMDRTTLEETTRAFNALRQQSLDMSKIKVILNTVPKKEKEKQFNKQDIEGFITAPIMDGIPYTKDSRLANNAQEALVLGNPTEFTKAVRRIGNALYPLQDEEEKFGLFSRFFGRRKG